MRHHLQFLRVLFVALLLCLGLSGVVLAQEITGSIVGTITDAHGAAIPNARVTISDPLHGFERTYQTTDEGSYTAPQLPAGIYKLSVEKQGFKRYLQENLTVNLNDRRQIDVMLEVGQVSLKVTILTETPMIQQSPTQQGLINGEQIRELPLN